MGHVCCMGMIMGLWQGSTLGAQIIRGYPEELLNNFGVPRNCF